MGDEDWVEAAMTDDSAVVELLMRLPHATPPKREYSPALPLEWSVRQRRSRPVLAAKKKSPTPRASPTTPLSWSGATSASGGGCAADGFEESSRPPPKQPEATRSKVAATSGTTINKRSRKKKTLAELKEDEALLLKERRNLKRELETLRAALEKQQATNESLKRLKLDLESQQAAAAERVAAVASVEGINDPIMQKELASCDPIIPCVSQPDIKTDEQDAAPQTRSLDGSSKLQQEATNQENKFMLPDLNLPIEDSSSEAVDRIIS